MLKRVRTVGPVGVDDGHGGGELLFALVMVGDDKIDAERCGVGGLINARDAAVDRDDQRAPDSLSARMASQPRP